MDLVIVSDMLTIRSALLRSVLSNAVGPFVSASGDPIITCGAAKSNIALKLVSERMPSKPQHFSELRVPHTVRQGFGIFWDRQIFISRYLLSAPNRRLKRKSPARFVLIELCFSEASPERDRLSMYT